MHGLNVVGGLRLTAYDFFGQLMYGDGFWIGLIVLLGIGLFVVSRVKWSGVLFVIIYLFLALEYLENLPDSNRIWGAIACILAAVFCTVRLYVDAKN